VQLHERDVLVSGGVKNQLRPNMLKEHTHLLCVRHVAHHKLWACEALADKLFVQIVERALVAVEED